MGILITVTEGEKIGTALKNNWALLSRAEHVCAPLLSTTARMMLYLSAYL